MVSSDMAAIGTETFGKRVRRLREKKGIRQVDLAATAQISWRHLIRIEQDAGGVTKATTVARLAGALGVDVDELSGSADDDEEADPVALMAALMRSVSTASAKQAVAEYIARREEIAEAS